MSEFWKQCHHTSLTGTTCWPCSAPMRFQMEQSRWKQTNCTISLTSDGKAISGSIMPDQILSCFSCECYLTSKWGSICTCPHITREKEQYCLHFWNNVSKWLVYPNGKLLCLYIVQMTRARCKKTSLSASKTFSKCAQASQMLVTSWLTGFIWQRNQDSCQYMITWTAKFRFLATSKIGSFAQWWNSHASTEVQRDPPDSSGLSFPSHLLVEQWQNGNYASCIYVQIKKNKKQKALKKWSPSIQPMTLNHACLYDCRDHYNCNHNHNIKIAIIIAITMSSSHIAPDTVKTVIMMASLTTST